MSQVWFRVAFILSVLLVSSAQPVWAQSSATRPASDKRIAGIKSWGYQLQNVSPDEIAASPFDLVVIDYSRNGSDTGRFTADEVKAMQRKPDGSRRLVLAYLSIGEAEDYRFYWNPKWVEPAPTKQSPAGVPAPPGTGTAPDGAAPTIKVPRLMAPSWLVRENEAWSGNYHVRYWYEGWQNIMFYDDRSYLRRIQDSGFDGVYLDRVDVYYASGEDRDFAARSMVEFVVDLAGVARKRHPEFLIVAQNGEELLRNPKYLSVINGISKEDLLFGNSGDEEPNELDQTGVVVENLMLAQAQSLPVLVVEYLASPTNIKAAREQLKSRNFIPYFGPRKLNRLVVPPRAGD